MTTISVDSPVAANASAKSRMAALFGTLQVVLLVTLVLAILLAVSIGAVRIPLAVTTQVIGSHLLSGWVAPVTDATQDQIIWVFRLPRVLLAVVVGAALGVSGTALQAMTCNPQPLHCRGDFAPGGTRRDRRSDWTEWQR